MKKIMRHPGKLYGNIKESTLDTLLSRAVKVSAIFLYIPVLLFYTKSNV